MAYPLLQEQGCTEKNLAWAEDQGTGHENRRRTRKPPCTKLACPGQLAFGAPEQHPQKPMLEGAPAWHAAHDEEEAQP